MTDHKNFLRAVPRYYFITGAVETLFALGVLLRIPADPKNAWLLGFSKTRLGLAGVFLAVLGGFIWLSVKSWRDKTWQDTTEVRLTLLLDTFGTSIPVFIVLYGVIIFWTYSHLTAATQNLTTLQGILTRIYPLILLALTRAAQTVIVFVAAGVYRRRTRSQTGVADNTILITRRKIITLLGMTILFLALASISLDTISTFTWDNRLAGFGPKFNLSRERNIPTYFSSLNLAFAGLLLGVIAGVKKRADDKYAGHWGVLALIFLFLSLDETAGLHEWLADPMDRVVTPAGIFYYSWVAAAIPLLLLFAVSYFKFLLHLPRKSQILFALAGVVYISGALGFELFEGWYADLKSVDLTYRAIATVEDIIEMVGVLLFIYALLHYLVNNLKEIKFRFT
jgi:hypothetical protein